MQEALDINTEEEEEEMGPTTILGTLTAFFTIKEKPTDKAKTFMIIDIAASCLLITCCIVVIVLAALGR